MREAEIIRGPLGLDVYPTHLKLGFQTVYDAIGAATEECEKAAEYFGASLWTRLAEAGGWMPAVDQTIDRLPAIAFGLVAPSTHFTVLVKEWATYRASTLFAAYAVFKKMMLHAGWKPSQVNSYLVVSLRMEETMFGKPFMADNPPDVSALDESVLNERERAIVAMIRDKPAFREA